MTMTSEPVGLRSTTARHCNLVVML